MARVGSKSGTVHRVTTGVAGRGLLNEAGMSLGQARSLYREHLGAYRQMAKTAGRATLTGREWGVKPQYNVGAAMGGALSRTRARVYHLMGRDPMGAAHNVIEHRAVARAVTEYRRGKRKKRG